MRSVLQVAFAGLYLAAAQAAPVPSGPEVVRDELVFAPKEGLRLEKIFEMVSELKLADYETKWILDGEEPLHRRLSNASKT